MLVVSDGVISTVDPIVEPKEGNAAWWEEAPANVWDLYEAMGAFRGDR